MTTTPHPGGAEFAPDVDLSTSQVDVAAVVQALLERAASGEPTSLGFPGAVDIDYTPVLPLFGRLFNNVGDPGVDPGGTAHTKTLERAVIAWCADLLGLPADDRWGYVTAGGTEGNLAALHAAHRRHPDALFYYSRSAHYSIHKIIDIIGAAAVVVDVDPSGEMDYAHLAELTGRHRHRPAVVIATAGTTMTEAVDDTAAITAALRAHGVQGHLHVDAALTGFPLALDGTLRLHPDSGIDSVAISGHKFFGAPIPCGVVLMRDSTRRTGRYIAYTATPDTTVSGSRCGQAAALLWYAIAAYGPEGHRERIRQSRELAAYTTERLTAVGWPAWRHPHAFTVVLRTPPAEFSRKWLLATEGEWSHVICMPGITRAQMDTFVTELADHRAAPSDAAPRQRDYRPAAGWRPTPGSG